MGEDKEKIAYRGRLAPTPSGYLHQGHILTFRKALQRTREAKGGLVFRMDDIDKDRCEKEFADACMEDIRCMGIDWEEGPGVGGDYGPYEQSKRADYYLSTLKKLYDLGCIYPCSKTRKEIRAHGLLDSFGLEYLYPDNFRPRSNEIVDGDFPGNTNWRFRTNRGERVKFLDIKKAGQSFLVGQDLSDFLVWRKDGVAAYELATVVDDFYMKINEVVRGEDLLLSSARQCMLFDALGWKRPSFYHCELILGDDGKKLSKSSRSLPRLFSAS